MDNTEQFISEYIEDKLSIILDNIPKNCTDITINPNNTIYIYDSKGNIEKNENLMSDKTLRLITTLLASLENKNLNKNTPNLSTILPKRKYRLEVLIPPAVKKGTAISIRIPNDNIVKLETLYKENMFTKEQYATLKNLVTSKKNIIISGETGSGKTTLLSALVNEIPKNERLLIVEEATQEIYTENENCVNIITNKNIFTGREAIMSSLRMNPDRIIYGETRDGESCLEMLKAWRTGHSGGFATIHAKSAKDCKNRIADLLQEVCKDRTDNLINDTIDATIHLVFDNSKRKIDEIIIFTRDL